MTMVSRSPILRFLLALSIAIVSATSLSAQSEDRPVRPNGPGTGKPDDELVPWKFAEKGAAIEKQPLTLYWLPASEKEMERSELLRSRPLIQSGFRCVAFTLVDPSNVPTIKLLGASGKLPAALLVNREGVVVRRAESVHGSLPPVSVERMVHDELAARDEAMYHAMSEARKHAVAGEKEAAIALYRNVWSDRCFFPLAGTEAQRALKGLGVEVHDVPAPIAVDPQLPKPLTVKPASGNGHEHAPERH